MKTSFLATIGALILTTSLVACNKDDKNNGADLRPLNVDTTSVAGAWQVESMLYKGQSYPAAAINNGEVYQYEITSSKITLIISKNNQVTSRNNATYTLENGRIVTKPGRRNTMDSLDVILVTPSTMQVRTVVTSGEQPQYNLVRIDASRIVGNSGGTSPAVDQYVQMDISTPTLKFSKNYKRTGGTDNEVDDFVDLNCRYDERRQNFDLNLTTYRRSMDPKGGERKVEAQMSLSGDANFDFGTDYEAVNFTITNSSQQKSPGFVAQFSPPRSRDIFFSLSRRKGRCDVSLTRQGSNITVNSDCTNVDANGDNIEGNSRIAVRGTCVLE